MHRRSCHYMAWFSSSFDVVTMYAGAGGVNEGTSRGNEREGALHGRETSSPASTCGGEEEAHCRSKQHCFMLSSFFFGIFTFVVRGSKNGLQQMPLLYNIYRVKTLHSKFCKDKQKGTSKTDLLTT